MVWLCRNLGGVHASFCPVKLCPGLACLPSLLSDTQYGLQVAWSFWCLLLRNVALLVLLHFLMETGAAWVVLHLISCPGLACHFAEYGVSKFAFQDHTQLCQVVLLHFDPLDWTGATWVVLPLISWNGNTESSSWNLSVGKNCFRSLMFLFFKPNTRLRSSDGQSQWIPQSESWAQIELEPDCFCWRSLE